MKRTLLTLMACICALCAWADGPFRNHRFDSFKALAPAEGSILFLGNSITDMHGWPEAFKTSNGDYLPIVNRGVSGTYSTEQSDNLETYLANKPKKVFMMIGTNDIASTGLSFTGEQVLNYVKSIVDRIHSRWPDTKIYLYSILNNNTAQRVEETWLHANAITKAYVEEKNVDWLTYIDLYDKLTGIANGGAWSYDYLHLTAASYRVWCDAICQYLQEGEDYTVSTVYPENTAEVQNNGGMTNAHGMRATCLSVMPISTDDILVFGDELVKNGEWQELLGNPNVKNRGTGWGYGGDIATTSKIVDATYANTGVVKNNAKAIFLYTGTGDANGTTDIATVKSNYKALVDKIVEKSPASKIYLMGLCPTNNASNNANRISVLNAYMQTLANDQIEYIDTYTPFTSGTGINANYFYPSNYLSGLGYVKMANLMKDALAADFPNDTYNVVSEAVATKRHEQAGLRNQITKAIATGLVAQRGNDAGLYDATKMAAFDTEIENAKALLESDEITSQQAQAQVQALATILASALALPTPSTDGNEHWYQITSLRSASHYITASGEAAGVIGSESENRYASSMWKFVDRGDNTFDIINREFGSYLSPVANYNTQIFTTKSQPTAGWTIAGADTPGYYIIASGNVQLNQTGTPQNYAIYNWSNQATQGNDRTDQGCQLNIAAAPEPIERPVIGDMEYIISKEFGNLYNGTNANQNRNSAWKSNGTPQIQFSCGVNNMNWSGNNVQMMSGQSGTSTYTLTVPAGYVIEEYTFTFANNAHDTGLTLTMNGQSYTTSRTAQTISATEQNLNSFSFVLAGTNGKGVLLTDFIVKIKKEGMEYTVDKANGNLYRGTSANQSWNNAWKSNATPQLQFGCGTVNNMNWSGNNVQMMSGQSGTSTYTLAAPAGYVIEEYTFTFTNNGHNTGLTLTMDNGEVYTTKATAQTISAKKQNISSFSFVLAGANNNGVVLTDFTVKIKPESIDMPTISTEGDVHWYYITSASTNDYCKDKVIYFDNGENILRFADKAFSANYIWSFWEQNGKLTIKNYDGKYFGTAGGGTGNSTAFGVVDAPNYIYTISRAYECFIIKDTGVELHAQNDGKRIVRWAASEGGASLWKFEEVDVSNAEALLKSTTVEQGKISTGIGNKNQPIVRSKLLISGLTGTCEFQGVKGSFAGTNKADVTNVKAYFATNARELFIDEDEKMTWREENGEQFGATTTIAADGTFTITGTKTLTPGEHYLWITYDIADNATEGNTVDAQIASYTVDGATVTEKNGNPAHQATIFLSEGAVLMPMDKGSLYYRIPAITVTRDGKRLVTLTDDRKAHNTDLPAHCYVVAQYSEDNGKTWSDPQTVAGTATTGGNYGHGDASIVTNRDNGDIVGIMTSAGTYGHGFFAGTAAEPPRWKTITSRDGGLTWETPVDHTDDLFGANCPNPNTNTWKSGFSGSGAALQKRDGTLVSSFVNRQADNTQHFYFFMSDDGGENWYVSGTSGTSSADEPKTLERNNGDLAISVRAGGYNYYNYTSDNGETWHLPSQTRFTSGISGNACDGEYMVWCSTLEGNPWNIAFQTLPNSGSRQNVSIALSTDEGATFGTPKTICPRGSAYSAAVVLPDGTLGVYYEENGLFGGFTMRFVRFSLDWASNGAYSFSEENPFRPIKSTVSTAIEDITTDAAPADNSIYDLQGRRIDNPTTTGIYIQNGKKIFIKK